MAEEDMETLQEESQDIEDEPLIEMDVAEPEAPEVETPDTEIPSLEEDSTRDARILEMEASLVEKSQQIGELDSINQ